MGAQLRELLLKYNYRMRTRGLCDEVADTCLEFCAHNSSARMRMIADIDTQCEGEQTWITVTVRMRYPAWTHTFRLVI